MQVIRSMLVLAALIGLSVGLAGCGSANDSAGTSGVSAGDQDYGAGGGQSEAGSVTTESGIEPPPLPAPADEAGSATSEPADSDSAQESETD